MRAAGAKKQHTLHAHIPVIDIYTAPVQVIRRRALSPCA